MKHTSRRSFLKHSAALSGSLMFYPLSRTEAAIQPITAAHSVNTAIYAPQMVAQAKGFMKDQGLHMHIIEAKGGSNVRRILAAGQVGYALGDSSHPLVLSGKGRSSKILMATDNRCSYANIIVRKELYDKGYTTVQKLSELKKDDGSKPVIAATRIGSGTYIYGTYVLQQYGVNDKFQWIGGGGSKTMLGGLKTGKFDAIMAVPAWQFVAEDDGYGKAIYDVASLETWNEAFGGAIPTTIVYVLENTILDNPEITQKYINGMYHAMQWIKESSVDQIYNLVGEEYMSGFKAEQAKREIAYYKNIFNYEGSVDKTDFDNGAKVWFRDFTKIKRQNYSDVVDMSFLNKSHKS